MSFSASSIFLIFLILGQLSQEANTGPLNPLTNVKEVQQVLGQSCKRLSATGPLAAIDIAQLIEFQRESLILLEKREKEFVANHCEEQKKSKIDKALLLNWLNPRNKKIAQIQKLLPDRDVPGPELDLTCNKKLAREEFAKEFGGGHENPLDEQLKIFGDFRIPDLIEFWDAFCSPTQNGVPPKSINYQSLLETYNGLLLETRTVAIGFLENYRTSRGADIVSEDGQWMGPFMDKGRVVRFVPLQEIPQVVRRAFIAAEDKNFYSHRGVEAQGIMRGFFKYLRDGSVEGGSTITQQLVKNLILGNEVSLDRKAREMLLARRLEDQLSKDQILEAYLNIVYLGRGAKGVASAVERYFGKEARIESLNLNQATFFAGITHSPNRYNPSLASAEKIKGRQSYVLNEMRAAKMISEDEARAVLSEPLLFQPLEFPKTSYFQAAASSEYLTTTPVSLKAPEKIVSSQNRDLQNFVDQSVQKSLAQFEMETGKVYWRGPLRNIAYLWREQKPFPELEQETAIWKDEMTKSQSLFTGVNWQVVVLLKKQGEYRIGFINEQGEAQITKLSFGDVGSSWFASIRTKLKVGDVIFAEKKESRYFFRVPPTLQASVLVMDVNTGEVKALNGGFDYSLAPYNRASRARRQPGSTVKPFTYLAALEQGFQFNEEVRNAPISFSKIPGCTPWSPQNYSRTATDFVTFENGLIQSNNRVTAQLLNEIFRDPQDSLKFIYNTMVSFGLYDYKQDETICYPVILGSKEVSVLRMAQAYAAIANGGWLVSPTYLKKERSDFWAQPLTSYRRSSIAHLSEMLSKVVSRGTGYALRKHQGRVAGKTGTSSNYRDAWFAGYSNYHVVVAWMGYDEKSLRLPSGSLVALNMGSKSTGGRRVAPLVNEIFDFLFSISDKRVVSIDPGTPLNFESHQYAFDQIWSEQIAQLGAPDWAERPLFQRPIFSDALGNFDFNSNDREITVQPLPPAQTSNKFGSEDSLQPSPELQDVLREDSWQRMQQKIENLLETID